MKYKNIFVEYKGYCRIFDDIDEAWEHVNALPWDDSIWLHYD